MDVAHEPGRAIGRSIAAGESVEHELDRFISAQHDRRVGEEGERPEVEAWQESERRHQEKRRQMARIEWHLHHTAQAERLRRTLESLIARHEEQAAKLMDVH